MPVIGPPQSGYTFLGHTPDRKHALSPIDSMEQCDHVTGENYICFNGTTNVNLRNTYPSIQEVAPRHLFLVCFYSACFLIGICGNSSIMTIIHNVLTKRAGSRYVHKQKDYTIFYIGSLCVVDFVMLLSLPTCISDIVIGFWMFGTWICKLHHVCSSLGRVVSTFIITAMSFDRYIAVCHPLKSSFRSKKCVMVIVFSVSSIALILLSPLLGYAESVEILHKQTDRYDPQLDVYNVTRIRFYKCTDNMPPEVILFFTLSTFILGYAIPLILIVFFNVQIITTLRKHQQTLPSSGIPITRISIYTSLIAVTYFVFWTPYWLSNIYSFMKSNTTNNGLSESLVFILYCIHMLPYIGCASNWIFYGLLNTQLQQKTDSAQISLRVDRNTVAAEKSTFFTSKS
uniref:G_PROTEIN_RECEP_F1_2 domain-containing protein n=1 Tax=Rhabditophanes sp. KR3021 TaxID=114890 RepID=A0AC35TYN3_9BILA